MGGTTTTSGRPRLAYVYDPRAYSAFTIDAAARHLCDLVWIVDSDDPRIGSMPRLLAKMGEVVDVAGMGVDGVAAALKAARCDGIFVQVDHRMRWTAAIADRLGFPAHSPVTALLLTDKLEQRAALRRAGLRTPKVWALTARSTEAEWKEIEADESAFPAVLKPRSGGGSVDTFFVHSTGEARALVCSPEMIDRGHDRDWILEEYIPDARSGIGGDGFAGYVSVESAVQGGEITHVAVTGRPPLAKPFRETGAFVPAAVSDDLRDAVCATATRAIRALGVTDGCLHVEIKLSPAGPVVIEVNGRLGGGSILELIEKATGVELLEIALKIALGIPAAAPSLPPASAVGYFLSFQAPAGIRRIDTITGLDEVKALPGVDDIVLRRGPGDVVDWRDGSGSWVFSLTGTVPDHEHLRDVIGEVDELVDISGE